VSILSRSTIPSTKLRVVWKDRSTPEPCHQLLNPSTYLLFLFGRRLL
jgi:hypothetical protein